MIETLGGSVKKDERTNAACSTDLGSQWRDRFGSDDRSRFLSIDQVPESSNECGAIRVIPENDADLLASKTTPAIDLFCGQGCAVAHLDPELSELA